MNSRRIMASSTPKGRLFQRLLAQGDDVAVAPGTPFRALWPTVGFVLKRWGNRPGVVVDS